MPDMQQRLARPTGPVDVILDTDTFNEVDDQFALAYLILSDDKLKLQGVTAAPFSNQKAATPLEGMEKSYGEILHILELMDREDLKPLVYKGSGSYLPDEKTPVDSPAARFIVQAAKAHTPENPLYVIAIGAITNVASALLLDPAIGERMNIVFLGGHALDWPDQREFNLRQDIAAFRVIMNSSAALVQLPCRGVVSEFRSTAGELEMHLRGKNKLCDYLVDLVEREVPKLNPYRTWSKIIWDVTAVGYLTDLSFEHSRLIPRWIPEYDNQYAFNPTRPLMRYVYSVERDALFQDLCDRLSRA